MIIRACEGTMAKRAAKPEVEAIRLLGKWTRIAGGHVSLSAGCSCGLGFNAVRVQDFEQDIMEFLRGRHDELMAGFLNLNDLLTSIIKNQNPAAKTLLVDLERSI